MTRILYYNLMIRNKKGQLQFVCKFTNVNYPDWDWFYKEYPQVKPESSIVITHCFPQSGGGASFKNHFSGTMDKFVKKSKRNFWFEKRKAKI